MTRTAARCEHPAMDVPAATVFREARGAVWLPAATAVGLAVLLRVPFLGAPLTADEGGYAEVARLWSRGEALYRGDWVDRPQGLILVFRALLAAGASSTLDLRLAAAGFGCLLVVAIVAAGSLLGGRRVGALAGVLVAVAAASPFIEGFTLAGELVAAVAAAAAIAAFARFERGGSRWLLVVAGLLGGSAVTVKQSAFDAILAIGATLAITGGRRAARDLATLLAAAVVPIALCVGWSGDPRAWYDAVVAYGLHASPSLSARAALLADSLPRAALALGPVAVLALLARRGAPLVVPLWIAAAALGVCLGGDFHEHYYLQLAAPLSLAAGFGLVRAGGVRRRVFVAATAVSIAAAAPLWPVSGTTQARAVWPGDRHLTVDAAVARYVRQHTTPSQAIYVVWAAADVYYLADRRPAFPYLWLRNLRTIHGAPAAADRMLARRVPALVVEAQPIATLDRTRRTAAILRADYRGVIRVDGDLILRRRGS